MKRKINAAQVMEIKRIGAIALANAPVESSISMRKLMFTLTILCALSLVILAKASGL